MSRLLGHLHDLKQHVSSRSKSHENVTQYDGESIHAATGSSSTLAVDLIVQFISATGLPKMDVVGSADPYLVARIDGKVSYVCVCHLARTAMGDHRRQS